MKVPPDEFQRAYSWSPEQYRERVSFLISKNYAYEKKGKFYSSCMVVPDREGRDLFRYAEPLSQEIAEAVISNLDTIKDLYLKTEMSKTTAFQKAAFIILSGGLLDAGQISNVEKDFLAKERPLRHGKNYYFALLQNLNSSGESFGIYGNMTLNGGGIYGNNRKALSASQIQEQSKGALVIGVNDDPILGKMISVFRPVLIDLLQKRNVGCWTSRRPAGFSGHRELTTPRRNARKSG